MEELNFWAVACRQKTQRTNNKRTVRVFSTLENYSNNEFYKSLRPFLKFAKLTGLVPISGLFNDGDITADELYIRYYMSKYMNSLL